MLIVQSVRTELESYNINISDVPINVAAEKLDAGDLILGTKNC